MNTLFPEAPRLSQMRDRALEQYFTPGWAAEALVEEFFPWLGSNDLVIEPSCGRGAFLQAIPESVRAIGVEIDAELSIEAAANTGREIITGDFRTVELPSCTAVIGNPPFNMPLIEQFLARAHSLLVDEGRCAFLLPSHVIQTPSRVLGWAKTWSLSHHLIPRTLFPRMIRPLLFMQFIKGERKTMSGFALYREADEINRLPSKAKLLLIHGKPKVSCWRALVEWALTRLGGRASLSQLYDVIHPHRPPERQWWREKVRQTLQRHFQSAERGVWTL